MVERTDHNGPVRTVCTEYPDYHYAHPNYKAITVHGNTEQLVRDGHTDLGIVIMDTGKTIKENDLIVVQELECFRLGVFFSEAVYENICACSERLTTRYKIHTIYFYSVDGPYGFMSNFYPAPFTDDDDTDWETSEHYYQAHKFYPDIDLMIAINQADTPKLCYRLAWQHADQFRKDWAEVKDSVMSKALRYKFDQNPVLREKLLATGKRKLVEHALRDYHFGCGADGSGKNMLGVM